MSTFSYPLFPPVKGPGLRFSLEMFPGDVRKLSCSPQFFLLTLKAQQCETDSHGADSGPHSSVSSSHAHVCVRHGTRSQTSLMPQGCPASFPQELRPPQLPQRLPFCPGSASRTCVTSSFPPSLSDHTPGALTLSYLSASSPLPQGSLLGPGSSSFFPRLCLRTCPRCHVLLRPLFLQPLHMPNFA